MSILELQACSIHKAALVRGGRNLPTVLVLFSAQKPRWRFCFPPLRRTPLAFAGGSLCLSRAPAPHLARSFSLLQLQPRETYFEDFSVQFYPPDLPEAEALQRGLRGRLKLCSHSVIYDPLDPRFPLLRVRLCMPHTHYAVVYATK